MREHSKAAHQAPRAAAPAPAVRSVLVMNRMLACASSWAVGLLYITASSLATPGLAQLQQHQQAQLECTLRQAHHPWVVLPLQVLVRTVRAVVPHQQQVQQHWQHSKRMHPSLACSDQPLTCCSALARELCRHPTSVPCTASHCSIAASLPPQVNTSRSARPPAHCDEYWDTSYPAHAVPSTRVCSIKGELCGYAFLEVCRVHIPAWRQQPLVHACRQVRRCCGPTTPSPRRRTCSHCLPLTSPLLQR